VSPQHSLTLLHLSEVRFHIRFPQTLSLSVDLLSDIGLVRLHLLKIGGHESAENSDGEKGSVGGVVDTNGSSGDASLSRVSVWCLRVKSSYLQAFEQC
jgi:hypothetical protein